MPSLWTNRLASLLLVIFGILNGAPPSSAFEPSHDYWFIETLVVSDVELPVGVSIRAADPVTTPRGLLIIGNQSEAPLFVLSLNYLEVLVQETPDPNWKTRVGMAHEVASYLVGPERPIYLNTDALLDLDPSLVDRNVRSTNPPPENVTIPAAQSSKLLLVYGQQVMVVPFTLAYALNPQFNNGSGANTQATPTIQATRQITATPQDGAVSQEPRNYIMAVGVAGVAILAIAGWLVWRGLSHK